MNLLLAFILSLVMAVSGVAPLPAQSATATEWTVSNVHIGDGTNYVRLDEQLVLTASACAGGVSLQMKVLSGDQVMLPAALSLDNEKLLLSFGSCSNVYSFDNDGLTDFAELSEEDAQIFDIGTDFLMGIGSMAAKLRDLEYMDQMVQRLDAAEDPDSRRERDAEVEFEGALYPAKHISREYTDADLMRDLARVDCTDMPELKLLLDSMAQVVCYMEGVDPEKGYLGLAERYEAEPDELLTTFFEEIQAEGIDYTASRSHVKDAEGRVVTEQSNEYYFGKDGAFLHLNMKDTTDEVQTGLDAQLNITGPLEAPVQVDLDGRIGVLTDYSYQTQKDGKETKFIRTEDDSVEFDLYASNNAGVWSGVLNLGFDQVYDRGYESDRHREQESVDMKIGCTESRIAGDLMRSFVLEAESGFDAFYLSFDLLEKKLPFADPMEGRTLYEIDLEEESMTPQMLALMADAMSFSGSAMLLGAQPDIMEAGLLLDNIGYAEYEELDNIEEAKKYLGVPLPEYTPPAGYVLDSIRQYWGLGDLDFCYWSEAEQKSIVVTYKDFRGMLPYSGLDEAKLKKGPIVQAQIENGLISYVDVYTPQVHVCISTDGVRAEMMESLLSGLDIVPLYKDEAELAEYFESQKGKL